MIFISSAGSKNICQLLFRQLVDNDFEGLAITEILNYNVVYL